MPVPPSPAAEAVLRATADAARAEFGRGLDAAFVLGDLVQGGFAPLVSDVAVALVLHRVTPSTPARVAAVAADVWERVPDPLTRRLALSFADLDGVRHGGAPGRLAAVDRLDLLANGRLLAGRDARRPAVGPTREELAREAALVAMDRYVPTFVREIHEPALLLARGVAPVTRAVLDPVRSCFTLATGRVGSAAEAAAWFRAVGEPGRAVVLVDAAARWRHEGLPGERDARALLSALPSLHRQFVDAHAAVLTGPADRALAAELRRAWPDGT